jgi:hypothetical protein
MRAPVPVTGHFILAPCGPGDEHAALINAIETVSADIKK